MKGPPVPSPLFHYTCAHRYAAIVGDGCLLRPGLDGFVWLTDMARPLREALGLTSELIECDRTEYRFRVTPNDSVMWWPYFRRHAGPEWRVWGEFLESAPGARPAHWYLTPDMIKGEPA